MTMQINVIEYFERNVTAFASRKAVLDSDREITFKELHKKAISLGTWLTRFDQTNKPIAVFMQKSIESIIADLAITYSGNAYMNLDIKSPIARISNIIELIKPLAIITDLKNQKILSELHLSTSIIVLDEINLDLDSDNEVLNKILSGIVDTDPYCIINTSGSTGTPKGVVLNHRSFIDFTEWANNTLSIGDDEIIGSLSPLVFDIYSFELCMLMSKGSTIVILSDKLAAFPVDLLRFMNDKNVSFIFWVPTIMVNIANLELLNKIPLKSLHTIWFAGEVFPTKQFNYWKTNLTQAKFVNLYGPIEITLDCTYYIVEKDIPDNEPIPIGFPCRNTDILILNEKNELADVEEIGELCVRGSSLAMGYYNNPEKTKAAFVQNPLNHSYPEIIYRTGDQVYINKLGEIIFKGRKDTLIKHMGYRIELAEIEHVIINTLKLVENGCILYNHEKKEIILIYESKKELTVAEMRKTASGVLPKYMIPSVFIKMDELPRNPNGKIDRLNLSVNLNSNESHS